MSNGSVYIIAEIGINHNGSIENCYKMIDGAVAAGCDAVKLQFFKACNLYPKSAGKLVWKDAEKQYSYDIYEAVKRFEFPMQWIDELMQYVKSKRIELLSSVFDISGVDALIQKGIKKIKLSSYVITNLPLIEYCASTGLPMIISTGGATLSEVEEAVFTVLKYHSNLSLLHCSIQYPTNLSDCNLGIIETLYHAFPYLAIGYSDHTKEVSEAPVQAVLLGAKIIEKHITLDRKLEGPDHFFAINPDELKQMAADIRKAEKARASTLFTIDKILYGNTAKIVYPHEKHLRDFAFMKLFSKKNIKQGEQIMPSDISILRPGNKTHGIDPRYSFLFKKYVVFAKKDIQLEDPITWDVIL